MNAIDSQVHAQRPDVAAEVAGRADIRAVIPLLAGQHQGTGIRSRFDQGPGRATSTAR